MSTQPSKRHILIVDDDIELSNLVSAKLTKAGFHVDTRDDGKKGVLYMQSAPRVDLILIDVMMPAMGGFEAAKAIRYHNTDVPIIFITSQSDIHTKLEGFQAGADDYISKPFEIEELLVRIEAVLRRMRHSLKQNETNNENTPVQIGSFLFNSNTRQLSSEVGIKSLSIKEAELLKLLYENKGEFVRRDIILTYVWGKVDNYATNSMDVYLSRIRRLFKDEPNVNIENLHGTGFRLVLN